MEEHPDAFDRFEAWLDEVGSDYKAAKTLGISQSVVNKIKLRAVLAPRIDTASRIEEATRDWASGPIKVKDWSGAPSATTVSVRRFVTARRARKRASGKRSKRRAARAA